MQDRSVCHWARLVNPDLLKVSSVSSPGYPHASPLCLSKLNSFLFSCFTNVTWRADAWLTQFADFFIFKFTSRPFFPLSHTFFAGATITRGRLKIDFNGQLNDSFLMSWRSQVVARRFISWDLTDLKRYLIEPILSKIDLEFDTFRLLLPGRTFSAPLSKMPWRWDTTAKVALNILKQ